MLIWYTLAVGYLATGEIFENMLQLIEAFWFLF